MKLLTELQCPNHGEKLAPRGATSLGSCDSLVCPQGCQVPVKNGIPRFVDSENYAAAFGLQWKTFEKTQLDSYTGCTVSRTRLTRCLGGNLDIVSGKCLLEVGCGAGRFTELFLSAGARVCACDISVAVEANYTNCGHFSEYLAVQADVRNLPFPQASFDIVMCLGVIQHTPNPEETIKFLSEYVKPGGTIIVDHYSRIDHLSRPLNDSALKTSLRPFMPRNILRQLLLLMSPKMSLHATNLITSMLLPIHKLLWRKGLVFKKLRHGLCRVSPVADRFENHPEMRRELLEEWAYLDTHDGLTDRYQHYRSLEEIRDCLSSCGFSDIQAVYAGIGVEARGKKPMIEDYPNRE